jgi:hypothetical protein
MIFDVERWQGQYRLHELAMVGLDGDLPAVEAPIAAAPLRDVAPRR